MSWKTKAEVTNVIAINRILVGDVGFFCGLHTGGKEQLHEFMPGQIEKPTHTHMHTNTHHTSVKTVGEIKSPGGWRVDEAVLKQIIAIIIIRRNGNVIINDRHRMSFDFSRRNFNRLETKYSFLGGLTGWRSSFLLWFLVIFNRANRIYRHVFCTALYYRCFAENAINEHQSAD